MPRSGSGPGAPEEWFYLLDAWGAVERPHREIARQVAAALAIDPLACDAQAITLTVAVPADRVFDAFVDASQRALWLLGVPSLERRFINASPYQVAEDAQSRS